MCYFHFAVDELLALRQGVIRASTRKTYAVLFAQFWLWLQQPHAGLAPTHELINAAFAARVREAVRTGEAETAAAAVAELLTCPDSTCPPINFEALDVDVFSVYVVTLKKKDGVSNVQAGSCNRVRCALMGVARDHGFVFDGSFKQQLASDFRCLKRAKAQQQVRGELSLKNAKQPMEFSLFRSLCSSLLQSTSKNALFAVCFLRHSWNLMCRSSNTEAILLSHLMWEEDAYCVRFAWQKNDQDGRRQLHPKHCYANPVFPEVSIILGLGLYLMCSRRHEGARLFPEGAKATFLRILRKELESDGPVALELQKQGWVSVSFGSQSVRKGGATYVSSGTTASPSSVSCFLRAGWSLKGVQDTYLQYSDAGDQHIGRVVAGLPVHSKDFALLPPFFAHADCEIVASALDENFSGFPSSMRRILLFCLASVVFHSDWLRKNVPADHPVFLQPLFRDEQRLQQLKDIVVCRLSCAHDTFRATGIPPMTAVFQQLAEQKDLLQHISRVGTNVGSASVVESTVVQSASTSFTLRNDIASNEHFIWNNGIHALPEGYRLPHSGVLVALQHYLVGAGNIPPLALVSPSDFSVPNEKKRFSDLRFLMRRIEGVLRKSGKWVESPSLVQVNSMYHLLSEDDFPKFREVHWKTLANSLRKMKK